MRVNIWNKRNKEGRTSWIMEFTLPNEKPGKSGEYLLREEDIPAQTLWNTHKYNLSINLRKKVMEKIKE